MIDQAANGRAILEVIAIDNEIERIRGTRGAPEKSEALLAKRRHIMAAEKLLESEVH